MVKAWVETFRPIRDIEPLFSIAHFEGGTVFLPLILWRKNWKNAFIRTIVPAGYSDFDYHDPIVIGNGVLNWELFWNALIHEIDMKRHAQFDTINIDGIRKEAIGISDDWKEVEACPYINLSAFSTIDDFLISLKRNLRQDIKRRKRRLEENSDVRFEVFQPDELDLALQTLPELLKHHGSRWPNAYKAPKFHENLIKHLLPEKLLHFSRITMDGKTISWRIGFVFKSRYYSYMPTFDEAYKQYSPGKVHLLYCIEDAIKRKLKIYDQLRGAELYKNEWTNTVDTV
jgi:CelD/BcsL family acetyltransferase involved in cellulose biosynthesis